MAIEGALQDVGLADICQLLSMGKKTGCLSLTDRSNFGYIYFEDGRVIYASVLNRPDRLGELLVRNHVISRSQLSEAMEAQAHDRGARLGEVLVTTGTISEEVLQQYITLQIEEAVYYLFTWSQGSFHFDTDQKPDEEGLFLVSIPVENLLMEGARRVDEWSVIEKKIPSLDAVFEIVKSPEDADDIEVTKHQRRVLPFIDGERTVHDLVAESGLVEFDVGKALFPLIQAGFVAQAGMRTSNEADTPADEALAQQLDLGVAFYRSGMYEDAEREFEEVIAKDPGNARALFRLGLISFLSGRFEQTLDYFDRMPEERRGAYAVLRNRALALEMLGRFEEALEVLEEADAVRPNDPEIQLAKGIVRLRKGDVSGALDALGDYRTDPDLKTPSPSYYAYTVLAAGIAGQYDYAVSVGREGLGHHRNSGPLLVNQAAVLERMSQNQAAEALYLRAIQLNPTPAQAHKALGDHALARGDTDAARSHFEKAQKIDPRLGDDLYLKLGTLAYKDQDYDVARLLWGRALELNPKNQTVQTHLEALDASS
jgi:tetratricopeptide (TPR) repeat protein